MPNFAYSGFNPQGAVKGVITAKDKAAALADLKEKNITAKSLAVASPLSQNIKLRDPLPSGTDMSLLCSQLALMDRAGVNLLETMTSLLQTTANQKLKDALHDIRDGVSRGQEFPIALGRHPLIFDKSFVALVKAGIRTNTLSTTLDRVSTMYERNVKVTQEVRGALVQPAITIAIAIAVVILLSIMVIPQMQGMLEGLNVALPPLTKIILGFSAVVRGPIGLLLLAVIVAAVIFVQRYIKTDQGKTNFDKFVLRIPKIGDLVLLGSLSRVNRTLATLLSNGIAKNEAIGIAAEASGNRVLEDVLLLGRKSVERGDHLYTVLEAHPKLFPATITGMVRTGESKGELSEMLDRVSDFYERQVETDARNLTKYIEPFMIVFLGVIVGGLVLAVMLPLSEVIKNLST
ncbi:type II secretion system F family protein [Deinococcus sp. Leaf326]|uniref:type II secretion system F family protein n=1 Tax=Deinococcus sp. Leaf326 TaxID=1736338 RepID=UPI0007013529|nr:type II secretion system F family protein [Deinococcus sp. Leaf326]KQR11256.1 hypothetical protein ASF71_20650 [Deinococcus sp. Leaf326]